MSMDIATKINACKSMADIEALYPTRQISSGQEVVRIGPSPTGMPHIGTAMQAVINRAIADRSKGIFILRIEDTDRTRMVEGAEASLVDALKWLGTVPNEGPFGFGGEYGPYIQSERLNLYRIVAEHLVDIGAAYYCFCTPERLDLMRKSQLTSGKMPKYDGHCRTVDIEDARRRIAAGEKYVVRQKMPDSGKISLNDLVRGKIEFDFSVVDDTVLMKSDGYPTYHLAAVVDDHFMGVTTVVRGEEWISSTPKHMMLYKSLGWKCPQFLHTVLLRDEQRHKLSKRSGDTSIDWFRAQGFLPEGFRNFLTRIMWAHPGNKDVYDFEEFVSLMKTSDLPSTGPIVDMKLLGFVNGHYLHRRSGSEITDVFADYLRYLMEKKVSPSLPDEDGKISGDKIGLLLKEILDDPSYCQKVFGLEPERSQKLADLLINNAFYFEATFIPAADAKLLGLCPQIEKVETILSSVAKSYDPTQSHDDWNVSMRAIAKQNEVKDKTVFMLTRLAVSGQEKTPPLYDIMKILGQDRISARLLEASQIMHRPPQATVAGRAEPRQG